MAAKRTTKAATTKAATTTKKVATKKPAVVKKTAPAKKQEPKEDEVVVKEKPKMSIWKKIGIGAAAAGALIGAVALHGRSKYHEGSADQAALDIEAYSQKPTEVNVYLTDSQAEAEEPVEQLEEAAEEIEEI